MYLHWSLKYSTFSGIIILFLLGGLCSCHYNYSSKKNFDAMQVSQANTTVPDNAPKNSALDKKTINTLKKIKEEINKKYGFLIGKPRINRGPCGPFAQIFFKKWNALFDQKVHICFVMTKSEDECDHILIRLPSGELYDGGIGIHADDTYLPHFLIKDMVDYDEILLEKWSYGLNRKYPESCPDFDRKVVEEIIHSNLKDLYNKQADTLIKVRPISEKPKL